MSDKTLNSKSALEGERKPGHELLVDVVVREAGLTINPCRSLWRSSALTVSL
jgi:hypothetical protein